MGRPEEIERRLLGEENNCDVVIARGAGGRVLNAEAYIPVFAGAGILALLDVREIMEPGEEVRRASDGRVFAVVQVFGRERDGRVRVELHRR